LTICIIRPNYSGACYTSAIETGVDLDCAQGYRELSGLDSIAQFAGRINRNMEGGVSQVIIFKTSEEYSSPPDSAQRSNRALQAMALGTDLQSPDVLKEYSMLLFQDAILPQKKYDYLKGLENLEWAKVSEKWQMIAPTTSVLVDPRCWNGSPEIVAEYDDAVANANYRVLQRHCVGLYRGKYIKAKDANCIDNSQIKDLEKWVGDYDMGVLINANL
jgi:hypothetical protein